MNKKSMSKPEMGNQTDLGLDKPESRLGASVIHSSTSGLSNQNKGCGKTFTVKPCWNSSYNGKKCLESEDQYGFFKSEADIRPSSCIWINKTNEKSLQKQFKPNGDKEDD